MKFSSSILSSLALVASFVVIPGTTDMLFGSGAALVQACADHEQHRSLEATPLVYVDETEGAIESRCDLKEPDAAEVEAMEQTVDEWQRRQRKLAESSRELFDLTNMVYSPFKMIDTVVHLLNDTRGRNQVTDQMVQDQMDVLNAAFEPGRFHFNLIETTYTVNDGWYNARIRPNREPVRYGEYLEDMGSALRVGGAETLNIYVNWPG
jgi:hypothetical protein